MLELKDITYHVEDKDTKEKEILTGVNLMVPQGTFMVLTGPNGGGKSTIAKIIMGILPPRSGRIVFKGEDITNLSITERAKRGIGFAFQQPVRFKGLKVIDLLRLATGRDISPKEACTYLSEVGLCATDYINREINASLSGGELKRIEIAILIAGKAPLSIFDEPEAGIDLWSFRNMIEVFERQQREIKGSILLISHQERILNIADAIAVIAEGRVKEMGSKEEILPTLMQESNECTCIGEGA